MMSRRNIAAGCVVMGIVAGLIIGPLAPFRARAGGSIRTYRCLSDGHTTAAETILVVHNVGANPAKITERRRGFQGTVLQTYEHQLPAKGSKSVGGYGTTVGIHVFEFQTTAKLLLDGFSYFTHPLEDQQDKMRQVRCT
jgi:hypothetical protein